MTPRRLCSLAAVVVVFCLTTVRADTQGGLQEIAPALLNEIRALRTTIATVAAAGAGGQLLLGRLQLQEQRVNLLAARLDTTRDQLAALQREALQQREYCARLEAMKDPGSHVNASRVEYMPNRAEIDEMLSQHRVEMVATTAETQRLTALEVALTADVATEQSRWSDLNQRLEEIERILSKNR